MGPAMRVKVRAYSTYADVLGREREVEVEDGATLGDLVRSLLGDVDWSRLIAYVNHSPADPSSVLREGDLVVIFPPSWGG
ncbi:MAG: MoaD/ThiS family protein [Desulfurococcaceae archaeon]